MADYESTAYMSLERLKEQHGEELSRFQDMIRDSAERGGYMGLLLEFFWIPLFTAWSREVISSRLVVVPGMAQVITGAIIHVATQSYVLWTSTVRTDILR